MTGPRTLTPEQRKAISDARKRYWANLTPEQRAEHSRNISKGLQERWANYTPQERVEICQGIADGKARQYQRLVPPDWVPLQHRRLWYKMRREGYDDEEMRRIIDEHERVVARRKELA